MRKALLALAAVSAFSVTAQAQEAAPVPTSEAAPATAATSPVVVAPTPPPAPPIVTLPTTGQGAYVIEILDNICRPAINGGSLEATVKAAGFKKRKDSWVRILGAKPYTVTVAPAGSNPKICDFYIEYPVGADQEIIEGLSNWAYLHNPSLKPARNDEYKQDLIRRTFSWDAATPDNQLIALVFIRERKLDGTPTSKVGERAHILYQIP